MSRCRGSCASTSTSDVRPATPPEIASAASAHVSQLQEEDSNMPVLDRRELEESPLSDLHAIASELGIEGYRRLRRDDLIDALAGDGGSKGDSSEKDESKEEKPKPKARSRSRSRAK